MAASVKDTVSLRTKKDDGLIKEAESPLQRMKQKKVQKSYVFPETIRQTVLFMYR